MAGGGAQGLGEFKLLNAVSATGASSVVYRFGSARHIKYKIDITGTAVVTVRGGASGDHAAGKQQILVSHNSNAVGTILGGMPELSVNVSTLSSGTVTAVVWADI